MVGNNWVLPPAHLRKGFALVLEIVCKFIYKLIGLNYKIAI